MSLPLYNAGLGTAGLGLMGLGYSGFVAPVVPPSTAIYGGGGGGLITYDAIRDLIDYRKRVLPEPIQPEEPIELEPLPAPKRKKKKKVKPLAQINPLRSDNGKAEEQREREELDELMEILERVL